MVVTTAESHARVATVEAGSQPARSPGHYCPPVHSPLSALALLRAARKAMHGTAPADLSRYLGNRFLATDVTLFDSGTHALTAAIRAAQRITGRRTPVALPAFTCYDVATAAVGADAPIILYDIDPCTLGPDWASFDAALARGAGVAVVAPLYGYPVDWSLVREKTSAHGTITVEDAAQAAGAEWNGRPVGSLGDLSVLSFGRGKGWTGAGGGAVLNRSDERIEIPAPMSVAREPRLLALAAAQLLLSHPLVYGVPARAPFLHLGETRYHVPSNVAAIGRYSAALVLATAEAALRETGERRQRAAALEQVLDVTGLIEQVRPVGNAWPGYLRFPVRITSPELKGAFLDTFRRHGAERSYPTPLSHLVPVKQRSAGAAARLPGAETLVRELVTVPTHTNTRLPLSELSRWLENVPR